MENKVDIENVFRKRAPGYDQESLWMTNELTTRIFTPPPFGGRRALDLCAGTGLLTKELLSAGWDATALDLSPQMLNASDVPKKVVGDAVATPFPDSSFDLVICRQGLHYLDELDARLELSRLSCREIRLGQIVAPTANSAKWWSDLFRVLAPGRKRVYRPFDLARFAESLLGNWRVKTSRFSLLDSFSNNFKYLDGDSKQAACKIVENMPKDVYKSIDCDGDVYRQDWEVVVAVL